MQQQTPKCLTLYMHLAVTLFTICSLRILYVVVTMYNLVNFWLVLFCFVVIVMYVYINIEYNHATSTQIT